MNIIIKELPETEVPFFRRTGSYFETQEHWGRLMHWAITNGLYPPQQSFIVFRQKTPTSRNGKGEAQ
jgi:DNA gyrase inhibitor GyrI